MAGSDDRVDRNRAGWRRVGWGILRYSVGYAGALVVATALVVRRDVALVGLVGLGCVLLLLAAGGDRGANTQVPGSQGDRLFEAGTPDPDVDASDYVDPSAGSGVSRAVKYALCGAGLILGGVVALVLT